jgi:NDP-sugar pyrophosphorylase family protein
MPGDRIISIKDPEMNSVEKHPMNNIGKGFIGKEFLPKGKDEYYLRDLQRRQDRTYRSLTEIEKETLQKNGNRAADWNSILVSDKFDSSLVRGCRFHGLVRIGDLESLYLYFHDLKLPVGLYNSTIISCDIGSNVVIDNVRYLSHYIIGDEVVLENINELLTTNHAKFGNGLVKEGEEEDVRIWLELANENGGRKVLPFEGMLPGDAYLWSKFRSDAALMDKFTEFTDARFDRRRGFYGEIGKQTIIKNTRIIKDVKIGKNAYIKGANKLKNLTINSSPESPSQIGEGVELVNGIIGYGSRIFYGVKAVRFIVGSNSHLKYGARLINSFLGDNATVSCCEVLNSLIFPIHEQHHNNSFLCAATLLGQCNIAAGVTIGSNHNSRGPDGEIVAGRGFWPGLCVSLKHNCKFAGFTLLAKGAYPSELNIPIPFSLVSTTENELRIMPGYWFLYNMYAIARNSWKYRERDRRVIKKQSFEYDYLAPDSVNEIFNALSLIEKWVGTAAGNPEEKEAITLGKQILRKQPEQVRKLTVFAEGIEGSRRPVIILKASEGYQIYRKMIRYYGMKTLLSWMEAQNIQSVHALKNSLIGNSRGNWWNVGGQLIEDSDLRILFRDIRNGAISSWHEVHQIYLRLGEKYPKQKAVHALLSLVEIMEISPGELDHLKFSALLDEAVSIQEFIAQATYDSRKKDYLNPFRRITYDDNGEMEAVLGKIEENGFIKIIRKETGMFRERVNILKKRLLP